MTTPVFCYSSPIFTFEIKVYFQKVSFFYFNDHFFIKKMRYFLLLFQWRKVKNIFACLVEHVLRLCFCAIVLHVRFYLGEHCFQKKYLDHNKWRFCRSGVWRGGGGGSKKTLYFILKLCRLEILVYWNLKTVTLEVSM